MAHDSQHTEIKKAIIRSQHCQRNFDLSKSIPDEDIELLKYAATQCPSKQNVAFYKLHFISNRDVIEKIYDTTDGFLTPRSPTGSVTNSQTLANLLIVFEEYDFKSTVKSELSNAQVKELVSKGEEVSLNTKRILERDRDVAVGIAAGYLNLIASLLGYGTGCCQCFDITEVKKILNIKKNPLLLMGIGFKDKNLNRRIHHTNHKFVFPIKQKQPIELEIIE